MQEVPDLLNECLYNLRWMLTMQDPYDGGVYHKCTNAAFDSMVMPGVTKSPRYVVQKGTAATLDFAAVTAQAARIFRKYSRAHIAMKRGIRPVAHARDEAVLERADVAIFDVAGVVGLVTDQMLPEPALPDAAFVPRRTDNAQPLIRWECFGKSRLDQPPADRKIGIVRWQLPDRVEMIR